MFRGGMLNSIVSVPDDVFLSTLLFKFKLYFDCFSYKIISTIQYFPGSDGEPWLVLSHLLEFISLVKKQCLKCYTICNTLIIIQHTGHITKQIFLKKKQHQMTHFPRLFLWLQMSQERKMHTARPGLKPRTSRRPCEHCDHWATKPHGRPWQFLAA